MGWIGVKEDLLVFNGEDVNAGMAAPFNNNNFDKEGRVVAVEIMGTGWEINVCGGFTVDSGVGLGFDTGISEFRLLTGSSPAPDEFSSSEETIKSSSDEDDRENDELSWSDSMRMGSMISFWGRISVGLDFYKEKLS